MNREMNPYLKLKGRNIAEEHKRAAKVLAKEIAKNPAIIGLVLMGGAARGFADESSDIDIAIFLKTRNFRSLKVRPGEQLVNGYEFDIVLKYYPSLVSKTWDDMAERWAYSTGEIIYDPKGLIRKLLDEKVYLKKDERVGILIERIMWLAWYGIYLRKGEWRGYKFFGKRVSDFWIRRGDLESAHYILTMCFDIFLDLLFVWNNQLIPDEKWKYHLAPYLKKLPSKFSQKRKEITTISSLTLSEFRRRLKVLKALVKETVALIEKDEILPQDIYAYLIKNTDNYSFY